MIRVFGYYVLHTFVNALKKLFRTWVAILLVCIFGFGMLFGIGAAVISDVVESHSQTEERQAGDSTKEAEIEDDDSPMTEEERQTMMQIVEMTAGGIVLLLIVWGIWNADKSGVEIFTLPDVNLLFPSPNKPQSVLMLKTVMQAGAIILGCLYLIFQLPNLIVNLGLDWRAALIILLTFFMALFFMKLISVFSYTVTATSEKRKSVLQRVVFGIVGAVIVLYVVVWKKTGLTQFQTAKLLFASEKSRYIPVWGWIKGMMMYAIEERWLSVGLCFLGTLLAFVVFILIIWRLPADFYEDAVNSATTRQIAQEDAKAGRRTVRRERSKHIDREMELGHGTGAALLFTKSMHNRRRFAPLGILTKTADLYLCIGILGAVFLRFAVQYMRVFPIVCVIGFAMIFRALGNPIEEERSKNWLVLMPDTAMRKIMFCMLAGTANTAIDLLPGLILAELILLDSPLVCLFLYLFLVSLDFFISATGVMVNSVLPTKLHPSIKAMLQMMCMMIAIGPAAFVLVFGLVIGWLIPALVGGMIVHVGIGICFSAVSAMCLHKGSD